MTDTLPRWDVSDLFPSLSSREFTIAMEGIDAEVSRTEALFDHHDIRAVPVRTADAGDASAIEAALGALNRAMENLQVLAAFVYATVTTDSTHETAQAALGRLTHTDSRLQPLRARLADWVASRGASDLAAVSDAANEHLGPLARLSERAEHQMSESDEGLYAELTVTGSSAWERLHGDVTSQLEVDVTFPDGRVERMGMAAVRGLSSHADVAVRRAGYDAEMTAWPRIAVVTASAMNAIKGEAIAVNRRRRWESPLDASLFANSISRATFEAMHGAVLDSLPDFRGWMSAKSRLLGNSGPLPWWDLFAPVPGADGEVSWADGLASVRSAFATYSPQLSGLVDRAIDDRWVDAAPRPGKVGGAFCMDVTDDRSLVLLNWSGSLDSAAVTAHELGHAYHNVQLSQRTPLQRMLPMALAETASIFCETLVLEAGLANLHGVERLGLLNANLQSSTMVVVDIHSRFLFESEIFERRRHRTLGVNELNEMMRAAQAEAYGGGLDQTTAMPHMWVQKPHYYGSHFYNWPYTYGLLFGLGLFARYRDDPEQFRAGYDTMLSRAGMDTGEALAQAFGFDVTDQGFWVDSLDVLRRRINDYAALAASVTP